jgi:esterase
MTINLNYKQLGSGAPVIILHGLLGNHRNWLTIGKKISSSFSVFLPDARNHGSSPHTPQMAYSDMVDDLTGLIRQQQLQDITLIGHSMGGKTAMLFALKNPEIVKQLIVIDIAPVNYKNDLGSLFDVMQALDTKNLKKRAEATAYFKESIDNEPFNQYLVSNLTFENGSFQWRINLPVIANYTSVIRSFPEIDGNNIYMGATIFIKGAKSDYILDQHQPIILEKFPNAIFRTIPGAGHNPHVDQSNLLCDILGDGMNA